MAAGEIVAGLEEGRRGGRGGGEIVEERIDQPRSGEAGDEAGDVAVEIARPFAPSAQCSTTLRFAARGEASGSMPIAPREVASICFHQSGRFPFTVKSDDGAWNGVVVVGGAQ